MCSLNVFPKTQTELYVSGRGRQWLRIGKIQLSGDSAIIWIGTASATQQPPVQGRVDLGGGAYELKYTWREGKWIFEQILGAGVS